MRYLDFNLGAEFHHRVTRQVQEIGSAAGVVVHLGKQLLTPWGHTFAQGGDYRIARQEIAGGHGVEFKATAFDEAQGFRNIWIIFETVMNQYLPAIMA
jgi:hypothetical protein